MSGPYIDLPTRMVVAVTLGVAWNWFSSDDVALFLALVAGEGKESLETIQARGEQGVTYYAVRTVFQTHFPWIMELDRVPVDPAMIADWLDLLESQLGPVLSVLPYRWEQNT